MIHISSDGEILWESHLDNEMFYDGAALMRLDDGRLVAGLPTWNAGIYTPRLVWLGSDGDSLFARKFPIEKIGFRFKRPSLATKVTSIITSSGKSG